MEVKDYINNNRIKIIVKANSPENKIVKFDTEKQALRVEIDAPADKNKANVEIIKYFTRLLKKKVRIQSGLTSKEKVLVIE
ncbi:MAG: DUF167 domain-containing protein [Candidatus Woesearchaeota archaeon]